MWFPKALTLCRHNAYRLLNDKSQLPLILKLTSLRFSPVGHLRSAASRKRATRLGSCPSVKRAITKSHKLFKLLENTFKEKQPLFIFLPQKEQIFLQFLRDFSVFKHHLFLKIVLCFQKLLCSRATRVKLNRGLSSAVLTWYPNGWKKHLGPGIEIDVLLCFVRFFLRCTS